MSIVCTLEQKVNLFKGPVASKNLLILKNNNNNNNACTTSALPAQATATTPSGKLLTDIKNSATATTNIGLKDKCT